jgi:hypothetical protein
MKNKAMLFLALFAVMVWVLPVQAAKQELVDEEMDKITAAGDPTVVISEDGSATYTDESIFNLALPEGAQQGLRALTVQNVVGEVQLLVNLNVLSVLGDSAGTDQRNFSMQSWGSTAPLSKEKVDGVSASAPGGDAIVKDSGVVNGGDGPSFHKAICNDPCTGNGGDANLNAGNGAAAVAPGQIQIGIGSADVIVKADDAAVVTNEPTFNLAMEKGAQQDMGALFIANIVGRAQTAFNINIAAAKLSLFPSSDGTQPFADPMASNSGVIKQVNSGIQFRGTPIGVGGATTNIQVNHTNN